MSTPMFIAVSQVAKTQKGDRVPKPAVTVTPTPSSEQPQSSPLWGATSVGLLLLLVALGVYSKLEWDKLQKKLKFEQFRTQGLQKKLKLALETIRKMETNPDLINSREFNLDYLRMRMAEEVFHFAVVNQIKIKVKEKITQALRPSQAQQGIVGIASAGRQVDETFDVEYETGLPPKRTKRVLFRIQVRLIKLPTQATSTTINQIIDCIETYLSPAEDHDTWQPTIQNRIAHMRWDQKAKPTPMLVMDQSNEGVNVSFRTNRDVPGANPLSPAGRPVSAPSKPRSPALPPSPSRRPAAK